MGRGRDASARGNERVVGKRVGAWVLCGLAGLSSCTTPDSDAVDAPELVTAPRARDDAERAPPAAEPERVTVAAEGFDGPISIVRDHGLSLFEGDIQVVQTATSATVAGKRWANKTVPYEIAPGFAHPERVEEAIAHWHAKTALRFVPRTNQSEYLRFVLGRGCSSHVGRVGGAQSVTLVSGEHIRSLVGADFDPSTGRAMFWWKDGFRTVGRSSDIAEHELQTPYVLAAGKTSADLLDVAIAPGGRVHAYYRDGTFSVGTAADLGATQAPAPFSLPSGYQPYHVIGVAFAPSGHLLAWYSNGATSEGSAASLAEHTAPRTFTVPSGRSVSEVLAVGAAQGGTIYAWYGSGKASGGTQTDLGASYAPYAVKTLGHCGAPQVIHELGHAVGLFHEQNRLDRDDYVTIDFNNITAGHSYNFNKHGAGTDHGAYDYDSVMHYDSWAFSKNGQPTIVRKDGRTIPDPDVLSVGDVATIAWMYP